MDLNSKLNNKIKDSMYRIHALMEKRHLVMDAHTFKHMLDIIFDASSHPLDDTDLTEFLHSFTIKDRG